MLFVGDWFQLKPVCDSFIFKDNNTGYAPIATNMRQQNIKMFELTAVMRQDNGRTFAELLKWIHEGNLHQITVCFSWLKLTLKNMTDWKVVCIFIFKMSGLFITSNRHLSRCELRNMILKPRIVYQSQWLWMYGEHYRCLYQLMQEKLCGYKVRYI